MPPLIADAHAQAASQVGTTQAGTTQAGAHPGGGGITDTLMSSGIADFLPIILILAVFWVVMLRPQQAEQKKLKARLAAVKKGERVLTAGGIIGVVTKARDGAAEIEVEIAPNVRVQVQRDTLVNVLGAGGASVEAK
jgi:preprotein translocase subunit YajC